MTINDTLDIPLPLAPYLLGCDLGVVGFMRKKSAGLSCASKDDLDAACAWGAAAVVTPVSARKCRAALASREGDACEARGVEWYAVPIPDVGMPDAAFEAAWGYAGLRLRHHLRQGRNVQVQGSALVVARLLMEMGRSCADAIAAARTLCPDAIETAAEVQYLQGLAATASQVSEASDARAARVLGCVLGGAVGDAFGYAVEFDRWADIQRKHGPAGLQQPVLGGGLLVVSDDTQMMLFTLEALNEAVSATERWTVQTIAQACSHAYVRWGHTQGVPVPGLRSDRVLMQSPAMRRRRAPGLTCLSAVRAGAQGTCERPVNDSKGCGAVMRTAPLGLAQSVSPEQAFELGCMAGALTHGHPDGWLPAGMVAAMTRLLIAGERLEHAATQALALCLYHARGSASDTQRLVEHALYLADEQVPTSEAHECLGEGWTGDEALAIAVHAVTSAASFEDAVRIAANHDGDSDSTASIAGQLYGAREGIWAVPHAWVRRLDVLPEALELLADFSMLSD